MAINRGEVKKIRAFLLVGLLVIISAEMKGKERKVQGFYVQSKADKISLVYHTNQTKKMKRAKQKKNRWAIKSGRRHEQENTRDV